MNTITRIKIGEAILKEFTAHLTVLCNIALRHNLSSCNIIKMNIVHCHSNITCANYQITWNCLINFSINSLLTDNYCFIFICGFLVNNQNYYQPKWLLIFISMKYEKNLFSKTIFSKDTCFIWWPPRLQLPYFSFLLEYKVQRETSASS